MRAGSRTAELSDGAEVETPCPICHVAGPAVQLRRHLAEDHKRVPGEIARLLDVSAGSRVSPGPRARARADEPVPVPAVRDPVATRDPDVPKSPRAPSVKETTMGETTEECKNCTKAPTGKCKRHGGPGHPRTGSANGSRSKGGNPDEWPEDLRVREFPA